MELIYVYSIGKEMILNEYVDQKVFRTAYRQWGAAKNDQAIDGWFQFDYVLDLAKGTENQYIVIGWNWPCSARKVIVKLSIQISIKKFLGKYLWK